MRIRCVSFWKGYLFVDSVGCVNEKTWCPRTETSSQRFREDFHHDGGSQWSHQLSGSRRHPCLLRWSLEDSWNLLPQESGELQRWIRNVGQVFVVHLSREVFAWNLWIGGVKSRTSWRREVQRVTRWLRYVTENQIVCSSSLEETVNSDTWWSMQKKAGVERWCAKGLLLK